MRLTGDPGGVVSASPAPPRPRASEPYAMQPSSLVQEAFLRLLPGVDAGWRDRAHFFAVASQVMRQCWWIMRARNSTKRGGGAVHIPIELQWFFLQTRWKRSWR